MTALPSSFDEPPLRDLYLNRTSSSFGINVVGTTCGMMEESALLDDGCTGESIEIMFDHDVFLREFKVSSFGADLGRIDITGASSIDILSTGVHSLGDTFLGAGNPFYVVFVEGNGFSFDNFVVERVPEPSTLILIGSGLLGLAARRRTSSL